MDKIMEDSAAASRPELSAPIATDGTAVTVETANEDRATSLTGLPIAESSDSPARPSSLINAEGNTEPIIVTSEFPGYDGIAGDGEAAAYAFSSDGTLDDSDSSSDSDSDDSDTESFIFSPQAMEKLLNDAEGGDGARPRTKNELDEIIIPTKPDITLPPDTVMTELGAVNQIIKESAKVAGKVEVVAQVLIKAGTSVGEHILDLDSVLFREDRTVIGVLYDHVGSTSEPYYLVVLLEGALTELGLELDQKIFTHQDYSNFSDMAPIRAQKPTDASDLHDEEDKQLYWSDDEAEAQYKRAEKQQKTIRQDDKRARRMAAPDTSSTTAPTSNDQFHVKNTKRPSLSDDSDTPRKRNREPPTATEPYRGGWQPHRDHWDALNDDPVKLDYGEASPTAGTNEGSDGFTPYNPLRRPDKPLSPPPVPPQGISRSRGDYGSGGDYNRGGRGRGRGGSRGGGRVGSRVYGNDEGPRRKFDGSLPAPPPNLPAKPPVASASSAPSQGSQPPEAPTMQHSLAKLPKYPSHAWTGAQQQGSQTATLGQPAWIAPPMSHGYPQPGWSPAPPRQHVSPAQYTQRFPVPPAMQYPPPPAANPHYQVPSPSVQAFQQNMTPQQLMAWQQYYASQQYYSQYGNLNAYAQHGQEANANGGQNNGVQPNGGQSNGAQGSNAGQQSQG